MGSIESRDFKSIVKFFFGLILLILHFVFVVVSELFSSWRSLSRDKGLQSELEATNKDGDGVRKRLRTVDEQLERVKQMQDLTVDEAQLKYGDDLASDLCLQF